jgi:hypothetical protein
VTNLWPEGAENSIVLVEAGVVDIVGGHGVAGCADGRGGRVPRRCPVVHRVGSGGAAVLVDEPVEDAVPSDRVDGNGLGGWLVDRGGGSLVEAALGRWWL